MQQDNKVIIGDKQEVDLRKIWKNEEYDFSKWLSTDGIKYINEILDLTLTNIETEKNVGSFSCDIFAQDEISGKKVLIENQLEKSDNDHLGKILTYSAGLDSSVVVWIVKEAREEHAKAIEWLNEHSDSSIDFFLIEIHAIQIKNGNNYSVPAPDFKIIEKPNNFTANIKRTYKCGEKFAKTLSNRLEFWTLFNEYITKNNCKLAKRTPSEDNWYCFAIGSSLCHISVELVNKRNEIKVGMWINDSKEQYDNFYANKDSIEKTAGEKFVWDRMDSKKASKFYLVIKDFSFDDKSNYDELMKTIVDKVLKITKACKPYLI